MLILKTIICLRESEIQQLNKSFSSPPTPLVRQGSFMYTLLYVSLHVNSYFIVH